MWKLCLLSNAILEKQWEMTRNLLILQGFQTHNVQFWLSSLHGYHKPASAMAFSPHSFKNFPTLHMGFFWLVGNSTCFIFIFFVFILKKGRNHVLIIITLYAGIVRVILLHNTRSNKSWSNNAWFLYKLAKHAYRKNHASGKLNFVKQMV